MGHVIRRATDLPDVETVRVLWQEYWESLGLDPAFQSFAEELAGLPGHYGPPSGCLLLATADDQAAGCVAFRPLATDVCEMKRLYVRPECRGIGLGRALAERIVHEARGVGYRRMLLDTCPRWMGSALALYRSLGFRDVGPYYECPVEGLVFMELWLDQ